MAIAFTRYYNSTISYDGPLGYDWDFSFNRYLTFVAGTGSGPGTIYYHTGRGYKIPLTYTSGGSPFLAVSTGNEYYTVSFSATTSQFTVTDSHGKQDIFNSGGFLIETLDRNGNELTYTHDTHGNLLSVQDPVHSLSITITLDANYHISAISDSFGRTVSYSYDSNYNLTGITSPATESFPAGVTTSYTYDDDNRLVTTIDGLGNTIATNTYGTIGTADEFRVVSQNLEGGTQTFSYDDTAQETIYTDNKGFVTDYYWDGNGDIVKKIVNTAGIHSGAPSTYETDYQYDSQGRKVKETYPNGNSTAWTCDSFNDVLTVTKSMPSGSVVNSAEGSQTLSETTTYTYEPRFHQVSSAIDPRGNVTTYSYGTESSNPGGNLLSITYPATAAGTSTESFTYNGLGQALTHATPDGIVTQNTYDSSTGYLTQVVQDYGAGKLNATTQYTYDTYGHLATVEDPNGHVTTIATNTLNQVTEVDGALGEVEQKFYDANGNLTVDQNQAPGANWQKLENVYNSYQQFTSSRQYTDATTYLETDYAYDTNGNLTTVTDPLGHSVMKSYDERNMVYQISDPLGNITKYDYDGNGNLTKMTDELGNITTYAFDGLDKPEQKNFADSSYQTWKLDANGKVIALRTVAGNTITQTYDTRNRMLTQTYGSSTITNVYDIMGRVLTTTEGGTALTYGYDDLGRNISFIDQAGLESTYGYDLVGNRTSTVYPTGITVQRAHDARNRVTALEDGSGNTQATYSYDILDRVTGTTMANSTSVSYGYDLLNRLSSVDNTLGGTITRNYGYVYDNADRVTSVTEPRGTIGSGYSNRNEVTGITEPSGSPFNDQSFSYDASYNRSNWTYGSASTSYAVNNLDQYTAVASATPTWNSDGGLASFGGNSYTYDALGRLTQVTNSVGIYLFTYDPLGRRVKKVDENPSGGILSTTSYHYDGSEVAVEYQPGATYTYYLGLGIDQVVMRTDGTNKQWYYRDGHSSVSAVADNSGNVLEQYEYNAQGQFQITNASGTVESSTSIGNSILYTGRCFDAETGNYFNRARYYNPGLGRFISRDPLSGAEFSQGTNLYAYCGNNFLNASDPTGLCSNGDGSVTNPDGSVTTTITNPQDGSVQVNTAYPDGAQSDTIYNTDGTSSDDNTAPGTPQSQDHSHNDYLAPPIPEENSESIPSEGQGQGQPAPTVPGVNTNPDNAKVAVVVNFNLNAGLVAITLGSDGTGFIGVGPGEGFSISDDVSEGTGDTSGLTLQVSAQLGNAVASQSYSQGGSSSTVGVANGTGEELGVHVGYSW